MPNLKMRHKKGVVLYIVLGTLLIVIILANIILAIISSQSRITHHQVSRIQAQYAAQAGMNLALEKLRTGEWNDIDDPYTLCQSGCNVNDPDIPFHVKIDIGAPGSGINGTRQINITTNYTYTTP